MQFNRWLQGQINDLVGVQRCTTGGQMSITARTPTADLTAHMWTGVRVHVYIVREALKARALKGILQADTGLGIASLFILAGPLLPPRDQNIQPDDWLEAIYALSGDRLYTFTETPPALHQVHLERVGTSPYFRVVNGAPVPIEQLRYTRITVRPRALKGFWMGASFSADPARRTNGAARADAGPRYSHIPYGATHKQSPPPADPPPGEAPSPGAAPPRTRLELSYALLEVPHEATREQVKAAFRRLALRFHPDVSELTKEEAEAHFKRLAEAYEYIKASNKWS